jgi:hypothetical protein
LGELTAPAERMTSRSQVILRLSPRVTTSIPTAVPFSMRILDARVFGSTRRFGRFIAERRYARETLHRTPLSMKTCATWRPSCR